ncbi:MAG TPA: transposase [Syntrophales bacterium]|nr:transposase [Syntrophales bacterium]
MVSKRRRFTREFKIETVGLVTGSDQTVTEVAQDLEIHPNTLYRWIRQYSQDPQEAFHGKGRQTSGAEELNRLRRENQRLKMERDILKKQWPSSPKNPK